MKIPLTDWQQTQLLKNYPKIAIQPLVIPSKEDGFYFKLKLEDHCLDSRVVDEDNEPYTLFEIKPSPSALAQRLQDELTEWVQLNIASSEDEGVRWTHWIEERFDVEGQHPFKRIPTATTFLTKHQQKWFALLMEVPLRVLQPEGKGNVWLLNIKVNPDNRLQLIDGNTIFDAYHMNKKHWVSVMLNDDTNQQLLGELVSQSYRLVEGKN